MILTTSSVFRSEKRKTFFKSSSVSSQKSSAVSNIDIADILGSEISVNIDIGKGDIDPALLWV